MADLESSALDEPHKALFRFVDRVNRESPTLTATDLDAARAAGWSDEALYFAITVCALFNFYTRWITGLGVPQMSDTAHRAQRQSLAARGYTRS